MIKIKDIITLIHDNDVRIVDELGTGVYLLQGNYSPDAISVEYLNREVTSIYSDECITDNKKWHYRTQPYLSIMACFEMP